MSGYPDGALDAAHLLGTGTTLLEKPFTPDRLLTEVHHALVKTTRPAVPT
jgi:hypothetical protein